MGTALPVLIGLPLMGGPGGERERPVDGGAIDIDLPGGLRGAVLGAGALRGPVLGGAGALRGPVLGALGGSLDEPPPGVGGGERDLGALGGGCDFVALALAFGGGGAPGPLGGGPLGGPLGGGPLGGGALGGPFGGGAPGPGPGPAMSAATLAVSGVSARMLAVRSLSMRSVRAMP
jgi:hypothetical protein